ncbi:MAG: prepilin-type N-terminal cleavage/methylation domain-containing protein, partial [Armatimonadetes bacterium]|nr:prepilin-type N-terminal cleavage/methylation domain-containing protein [Akkermansiaceae bacterium]
MKIQPRQNSRGFTLVELLVVFVIIVVLVTVSITAIFRFRKSADKAVAIGNLRQLQSANTNYAVEHNGQFVPPSASVDGVTYEWYRNPEFIAALKGDDATFGSGGAPNLTLPLGLMDPAVVREKPAGYQALAASYGYT